ncbi:putative hydrolase [Peptococcaceae bacterium CEB3]|nr:putative hydrolase [Peptococcaceae bacterium CEB3]
MADYQELVQLVEQANVHPSLGLKHCQRVYNVAKELAQNLSLDDEILYTSAILHDLGKYPAYALPNVDHSLRSKGLASNILQKQMFSPGKLPKVLDAIESHMYYSEPGRSDEAVYLRDANILDHLGNIGIMRLFCLVGQDELLKTPEDAIQRARTFAEALPGKVATKAGRRLAVKRREEVLRFLAGLRRQTAEYSMI